MARPKSELPTPGELEILKVLWEHGPATVRQVAAALGRKGNKRAYTSVMTMLNIMTDKGLLARKPAGRAFLYAPKATQERTQRRVVRDLLSRIFDGSAGALVTHVLAQAELSPGELEEIRKAIDSYEKGRAGP